MELRKVYFVGDVHLDFRKPEREDAFCRFLDDVISAHPDALFLMGDIFEFWFGYKTLMFAQTIKTVAKITAVVSSGVRVYYIAGNHDFNPGPVFQEYIGASVSLLPMAILLDRQKVYLSHGDEIDRSDYGYRFLKSILRNPLAQFCFKLIPASLAWKLGRITSDTSRSYTQSKRKTPIAVYERFVREKRAEGYNIIIHGHTHEPGKRIFQMDEGDVTVINTGHWFGPGHYAIFENGQLELREFAI